MIKVGLVGEDPNDTSAIKNLLEKRYKDRVLFKPLVKGIKGHQLDSPKIKKSLPIEFEDQECKFIVYIRDLDAFKSQEDKLQAKRQWFKDLDELVNNAGILLLNIWELEALIFGDIETFNKIHSIDHKFKSDPMKVKDPKGELKRITSKSKKRFHESHCPEIFKQLDIDKIEAKCSCFKDFIVEFDEKLKN
ncbi:DUF4276 family protein [Mucilaginibacter sp. FT3.2]|uniref:DUF4276 family protein n=1 Tax=Mucilaginibacter sp. FT3.2 TaxID=2723090 RepID=UPI00160ADEF5|nr:DUF4276 family protein [Mucilaginibacter sp. FT3.2]MBB6235079.1 hypothetical protein [Mucilaginibacter sp. FT3.2]